MLRIIYDFAILLSIQMMFLPTTQWFLNFLAKVQF